MSTSARNDVTTFIALCYRFGGIGTSRPTVVTVYPHNAYRHNVQAELTLDDLFRDA